MMLDTPVRDVRTIINDSGDPGYVNRILIGTPTTGTVRVEWMAARYGQMIPCNWSMVTYMHFMSSYIPLRYQVAEAQNLIVKEAVEKDFEWLFLLEHDTVIPPDCFIRLNEYMRKGDVPIMSGLYFTRSYPSEPLVYRGRGNSFYGDWKLGDLVWCDGVPTGCLLIHGSILREMWKDSEEYTINGHTARRVFDTPRKGWFDAATGQFNTSTGTSDLDWCSQVIEGGYLRKAGWGNFVDEHPQYPMLIDTNLFCRHLNPDGQSFPLEMAQWQR
jgi:hypothetical protein